MTTITTCPPASRLRSLSMGEIDAEASDALLEHVAGCSDCQSELETIDDQADSLIASLRSDDHGPLFEKEVACQAAIARAVEVYGLATGESSTAGMPEMPERIGEYEILRPLGQGGMGSVWLARHTKLGREVAIKLLSRHRWAHPRMRERFEAEMRAIGRLSHPNIVIAHDARDVNGCAVLVTEYVDGFDLGQLLQRSGPLSIADACEIVCQVAVALEYTHRQGFVHRDIKPSNIMLSRSGSVKLLDLGLARLQLDEAGAEMTATGQAMGTADYMAPEQVSDARSVDIRADIYALGCTLFKLLTGRAPFADQTTSFAKMTAHVSATPPRVEKLRRDVPRELADFIARMLAKCPEDRPQTPADVQQALAAFCAGSELIALIEQAVDTEPKQDAGKLMTTAASTTTASNAAAVSATTSGQQNWFNRRVPTYVAIAAGLFGFFLGGLLSIIIIITNPDGTKSVLKLAEGSKIEIQTEEPSPLAPAAASAQASKQASGSKLNWVAYDEDQLSSYRRAGKTVMLYFTAEWDLVGKQNLQKAIESRQVLRFVEENGVVSMLADWTQPSDAVESKLRELNRGSGRFDASQAVPVLAIYPPLTKSEPIVLRGQFSPDDALNALNNSTKISSMIRDLPHRLEVEQKLAFGVIVNPTNDPLDMFRWSQHDGKPVPTPWGIWFPVQDGLKESIPYPELMRSTARIPATGTHYVLVSNSSFISWDQVKGQIESLTYTNDHLDLVVKDVLGEQFSSVTSDNIGNHLAIIANGTVRSFPKINSPINKQLRITGRFDNGELAELSQWLHSGLVYPREQQETPAEPQRNIDRETSSNAASTSSLDASLGASLDALQASTPDALRAFAASLADVIGTYAGANGDRVKVAVSSLLNDDLVLSVGPTRMAFGDATLEGISLKFDQQKLPQALMDAVDVSLGQAGLGQELDQGLELDPNGPQVSLSKMVSWLEDVLYVYPLEDAEPGAFSKLILFSIKHDSTDEQHKFKQLLYQIKEPLALGRFLVFKVQTSVSQPVGQELVVAFDDQTVMIGPMTHVVRALSLEPYIANAAQQLVVSKTRSWLGKNSTRPNTDGAEEFKALVETFLQPAFIKSSEVRADGFAFRMKIGQAMDATAMKAFQLSTTATEEPAIGKGAGIDFASLVRTLGNELRIVSLETPATGEPLALLFVCSVTNPEKLEELCAQASAHLGEPREENGRTYYPFYASEGDYQAADAIVCTLMTNEDGTKHLVLGAYERVQEWLTAGGR